MNLKHVYQSNLNNNKKYFLTLINKYKSNDLLSLNINIFSGRQILEEILLECKSNKLSNKINNEFLTKKIDILIRTNCLVDEVQRRNLNYIKEKKESLLLRIDFLTIKISFFLSPIGNRILLFYLSIAPFEAMTSLYQSKESFLIRSSEPFPSLSRST